MDISWTENLQTNLQMVQGKKKKKKTVRSLQYLTSLFGRSALQRENCRAGKFWIYAKPGSQACCTWIWPHLAFCDLHKLHLVSMWSFISNRRNHKENGLTEVCKEVAAFPIGTTWGTNSATHCGEGKAFPLPSSWLKCFGCFQPEKLPLNFPWTLQLTFKECENIFLF